MIAFSLFRPGFWMDLIVPPFIEKEPAAIVEVVGQAEPGSELRLIVQGENDVGEVVVFTALLAVPDKPTGAKRLEAYGLELLIEDGNVIIDNAAFDSAAQKAGLDFEQKILTVMAPADQPLKQLLFIPALLLLGLIVVVQRRRNGVAADTVSASAT
jgi:hypothetical protein